MSFGYSMLHGGVIYDSDAVEHFNRLSSTNYLLRRSVHNFVRALKAGGVWDKIDLAALNHGVDVDSLLNIKGSGFGDLSEILSGGAGIQFDAVNGFYNSPLDYAGLSIGSTLGEVGPNAAFNDCTIMQMVKSYDPSIGISHLFGSLGVGIIYSLPNRHYQMDLSEPDIVTNGDFSGGLSGWTVVKGDPGDSVSVVSGRLTIEMPSGSFRQTYAYQALSTVIGEAYTVEVDVTASSIDKAYLYVGESAGSNNISSATGDATEALSIGFVAQSETTYISLLCDDSSLASVTFDNVVSRHSLSSYGASVNNNQISETNPSPSYLSDSIEGIHALSVSGTSRIVEFDNAEITDVITDPGSLITGADFTFMGMNINDSALSASNCYGSAFILAAYLDATERAVVRDAINAYLTAMGMA